MSTKPKRTGSQKPRAGAKKVGSTANRSTDSAPLLADLRDLILTARRGVARAVDSGLVVLSLADRSAYSPEYSPGKTRGIW